MTDQTRFDTTGEINAFLAEPILGRFATASAADLQPHVVPVWFFWDGKNAWVSSYRGTRKIRELTKNPKCSLVIDLPQSKKGITAVLIEGEVELVSEPVDFVRHITSKIYTKYLGEDGVLDTEPQEWLNSPENLLIKLTPQRIRSW